MLWCSALSETQKRFINRKKNWFETKRDSVMRYMRKAKNFRSFRSPLNRRAAGKWILSPRMRDCMCVRVSVPSTSLHIFTLCRLCNNPFPMCVCMRYSQFIREPNLSLGTFSVCVVTVCLGGTLINVEKHVHSQSLNLDSANRWEKTAAQPFGSD